MRCAIMQPTFLPWAGCFRLISRVDRFVFLDDVQLARQSWQTRNRMLNHRATQWISAPIRHVSLNQTINETRISEDRGWRNKLCRHLRQSYSRHPFPEQLDALLEPIASSRQLVLSDLNIALAEICLHEMGIDTQCHRSSTLSLRETDRTLRLIEICNQLGCDTYVSPPGSADYLESDGFRDQTDIALEFVAFQPPRYPQHGNPDFVSHLSIVDIVANLGWKGAADYILGPWPEAPVAPSISASAQGH